MARKATKKTLPKSISTDPATQYAKQVLSGKIVAGPHVRNACQRFMDDLEHGHERGLRYDPAAAKNVYGFFEDILKLSEGQFENTPFILHPMQCFILGNLFGWKREDGRRRFRRAYIEAGKGCGKSPLAAGIGLYMMVADGEAGAQIYSAAAKRDQAAILFNDAVKMVRKSPTLASRLQFSGGVGREFNIAYHKTASFFRPVSKDTGKSGSGPRPYCVLADEVHEMPDRGILETLERGFKFRRNPLLFMITNSGSDRNSVAWEEHEHAVRVAAGSREALADPEYVGEVIDDSTFSYVCALDKDDDPLEDESCWEKVNPLLGVTITKEYLREVVAQAKALPGKLNGILRLHFCVWTDAETAWMTRKTLEPVLHDFDPEDHKGAKLYLGLDLSQNRDITALGAVVETGRTEEGKPLFDAWAEAWTPGDTMAARQLSDKLPYDVWVNEGWLNAPPGESINFRHVAQRLAEICAQYDVQMVAYDRYAFKLFEREVDDLGLSVNFVEHPQGGTRRGKAFQKGLDGLWSPESVRQLEDAILEHRVRIQKNPVLISALMSSVAEYDRWDNHWLSKRRSVNKIDAAVAVMMAMGAATLAGQVTEPSYQMLIVG